jgi:hypothetical protein
VSEIMRRVLIRNRRVVLTSLTLGVVMRIVEPPATARRFRGQLTSYLYVKYLDLKRKREDERT